MAGINANVGSQMNAKDELIRQLQDQVTLWRNKYEALAKLYSQLRTEHLEMLSKHKQMQLKANSAQEAIDKMERMEKDVKAKNLELADMIRERDRARFDLDRVKSVGLLKNLPSCSNSNRRIKRRSWIGCEGN
jgi:huntingtin-interacting protein 1-related protein